jgi:hypothetical protein
MALPLPAFDLNADLTPFAVIALSMIAITIFVLGVVRPKDGRPALVTQLLLALSVVGGGSVLLLALLFVFLDPNGTTAWAWVLLAFNFMMMVPVGLWFVGQIVFRDRRVPSTGWLWPAAIGVAVTGSEVLMGVLFAVAGGIGELGAVARGLSSVWFFWSMAAVMVPLVLWAPLSSVGRAGSWALVLAATIGPWVRPFPFLGGAAMAVVMGGAFLAVLRLLLRGGVAASDAVLLVGLSTAFLAMSSSGLAVAATGGSDASVLLFGSTMAGVMVAEVSYLVRRSCASEAPVRASATPLAAPEPLEAANARVGPLGGP